MPHVPEVAAARFVVSGRVQGVFFRDTTRREARLLGLAGWVRNRPDGTVEVVAQGAPAAIEALATFLGHGPPHAGVAGVARQVVEPDAGLATFVIRH